MQRTQRGEVNFAAEQVAELVCELLDLPAQLAPRTECVEDVDAVPFSWFEPMWLENLGFAGPGQGWRLTEAGETEIGGRLPVNPSGGVLSSNPIGASGLLRFAEAALQVMGRAGQHQVDGARAALGHAYGGGLQYFTMWVVASTPDSGTPSGLLTRSTRPADRMADPGGRQVLPTCYAWCRP